MYENFMNELEIRHLLRTESFGQKIHYFETIDSTNRYAKSLIAQNVEEGTMVIAEEQTAGRGRFNRAWIAERSKNLLFSIILKPTIPPEKIGILSLLAGVGIAE